MRCEAAREKRADHSLRDEQAARTDGECSVIQRDVRRRMVVAVGFTRLLCNVSTKACTTDFFELDSQ
jgi:hypothetical protein